MLGAILGDIAGSVYEFNNSKTDDPWSLDLLGNDVFFTDDSVMTIAVAEAILNIKGKGISPRKAFASSMRAWGRKYPYMSYGTNFNAWLKRDDMKAYNSWGNGSAMRVSSVGWSFDNVKDVLLYAGHSASVTHNHRQGIIGAQATALAVFMARIGETKESISKEISKRFKYDLTRTVDEIRPDYQWDESCQGTVPQAITCFLESESYEHAIRLAISLGGDSDTLACITGGIAEAFYKEIPEEWVTKAKVLLDMSLKEVLNTFKQTVLQEQE